MMKPTDSQQVESKKTIEVSQQVEWCYSTYFR